MNDPQRISSRRARLKRGLWSLIWTNLARSKRNIAMSSIGILVGVGALVFFIGLGEGIKQVVLGKVFIVDQVEVIPPKVSMESEMFGWGMSKLLGTESNDHAIDPALGESFKGIKGIVGAYPKMKFTFPAFGYGGREYLMGRDIRGELIADGISAELVAGDLDPDARFIDREAPRACSADTECGAGMTCNAEKMCEPLSCTPPKQSKRSAQGVVDACPTGSYCAADLKQCLRPIPVVINPKLLELYNGGLAIALKLPQLDPAPLISKRPQFNMVLNRSAIIRKRRATATRRLEVVGMSDKAINLGVTMPIDYVKRFNARFTSEAAGKRYHSVILKVNDQRKFPEIVEAVEGARAHARR